MTGKVQIIVGGQYGSEAKGAIAARLCQRENVAYAVRTGATNAGHTVVYNGARFAMQQLPVGWVNPSTKLVLGAGALIDLAILEREVVMIAAATGESDPWDRIHIDGRAFIHTPEHRNRSESSGRHHMMGATGKGCSEALTDRIKSRGYVAALGDSFLGTIGALNPDFIPRSCIGDTEELLNDVYSDGDLIQLEGTQGQQLDLYLGPYPYVTHKQTGPAQWLLEAGLSPRVDLDIIMVVRTFPIRVAGNSGPMNSETSWPELARDINAWRTDRGGDPIIQEETIIAFENAVRYQVANHEWKIPFSSNGLDQHRWPDAVRYSYRFALSELYKSALDSMPDDKLAELKRLFEMTTVTKKLRRIGDLDEDAIAVSARQIRPTRVAVTFLNYLFPDRWYCDDPVTDDEDFFLRRISKLCDDAPVDMVSRGPDPEHIVEV